MALGEEGLPLGRESWSDLGQAEGRTSQAEGMSVLKALLGVQWDWQTGIPQGRQWEAYAARQGGFVCIPTVKEGKA